MTGRPEHCRRIVRSFGFDDPAVVDTVAAQFATDRARMAAAAAVYLDSGDIMAALAVYGVTGPVTDPTVAVFRIQQVMALDTVVVAVAAAVADDDPDEQNGRAGNAVAALRAEAAAWEATTLELTTGPAGSN